MATPTFIAGDECALKTEHWPALENATKAVFGKEIKLVSENFETLPDFDPFEAVNRVTYKPDTIIRLDKSYFTVMLHIQMPIHHDSVTGKKLVSDETNRYDLNMNIPVPLHCMLHEDCFFQFVRDVITAGEKHESDEWFRIDGVAVFDPHFNNPYGTMIQDVCLREAKKKKK